MMSIHEINPEELRRYIGDHNEKDYLLVDVRQPGEYQEGHIPGARLLPLPELVLKMDTLPQDLDLVFYCHSGARSMVASIIVEEEFGITGIYNLSGGILSWDGAVAESPPQVRIFDKQAAPEELYMTAMNLEKGAMNFYMTVDIRYGGETWSDVFGRLAEAEIAHALAVYRLWRNDRIGVDDFDTVFVGLSGNVLEGGMTLAEALDRTAASGCRSCVHLMELALNIEYSAFDLYRTMADQAKSPETRDVFLRISQAEKSHMNILIDALSTCPS
jgi:sulfur-carrier protein adenylyltransferase/sulfurtransferase